MKVVAINSSPRVGRESKTEMMLDALVLGMRDAGAEVEIINLKDKKIKSCQGCYSCWTKTPGVCIHQDDMSKEILPKLIQADLTVYASPLYFHTMTGSMHTLMERTLPSALPYLLKLEDGTWSHPGRYERKGAVVLSVCGFPEMQAFDVLKCWVDHHFKKLLGNLWAEIYRPGAESFSKNGQTRQDILAATRKAGQELVETKGVSAETLAVIEKQISGDTADMIELANCFWDTCIKKGITPKEFAEKDLMPEPGTIPQLLALLKFGFNRKGAGDTKAVIQFNFSGPVEGVCHMAIENGSIDLTEGPADKPDLVVKTPFDLWVDIMAGRVDGAQSFMEGKYTVEGRAELLMKIGELFGR